MKIIQSIPNFITCLNLLSGACAIIASFRGYFDYSLGFVLMAAFFDFLDGFAARCLKAYSNIGKELDSLSDVVSFGLAPALIMFNYMSMILHTPWYLSAVALLLAVFSALRLAKFNVDDSQSHTFKGLATPASAILVASLVSSAYDLPYLSYLVNNIHFYPIVTVILCILLVSHIPMFSLKMEDLSWQNNKLRYIFFLLVLVLAVVSFLTAAPVSIVIFRVLCLYIIYNIVLVGKIK